MTHAYIAPHRHDLPIRSPDEPHGPVAPAGRASKLPWASRFPGQRVDNFLALRLKGVPRSRIYRLLRRGEVRVNRGRVRQELPTGAVGDVVRVPPVWIVDALPRHASDAGAATGAIERAILHEDEGLIVLNKPAGLGGARRERRGLRRDRVLACNQIRQAKRTGAGPSDRS